MNQCPRCKRAEHGGSCANPMPLAPASVRQAGARQAAHVGKTGPVDAPALEMSRACALHAMRLYGWDRARAERFAAEHSEACKADPIKARAMCFELDPKDGVK